MSKKLFVGNLSFGITEQYLSDTFAQYGTVESCRIITDRDSGRSKGFGFVEMSTDEEAVNATNGLNNTEHEGRKIAVSEAKPQAPRENRGGPRMGGGRGFGGGGGGRGFGGGGGRGGQRGGGGGGGRW